MRGTQWKENKYKKNSLIQKHFQNLASKRDNTNKLFKAYYSFYKSVLCPKPTLLHCETKRTNNNQRVKQDET